MLKTGPISKTVAGLPKGRFARFGSFEVDLRERKLTKGGIRIRLQEQPFRILALLLERPGQLVTREEIRSHVWPQDLFVDFDAALNTAMGKLRTALSDTADNPRFLETVPRHGYRFVAPVIWAPELDSPAPAPDPVPATQPLRKQRYLWYAAALLVAAAGVVGFWIFHRATPKITPEDTIVLADFVNTTGDATFDDALNTALRLSLEQSPFFTLLSDSVITRTLQQMTRPAGTRLTGEVTRELCQRAGSKAYLVGSISTLGSQYVLGLKAVNCRSGDTLAEEQALATSKEKVLDALGQAASKIRGELGESLASVQKYDVPLARATTSSLEALKSYSLGVKTYDQSPADAIRYFAATVEKDPNCAVGYRGLGLAYSAIGQTERAREYYTKAFQLLDHVGEWEKWAITGDYYMNVTGELDKAAQTYEHWIELYPHNDGSLETLAVVYTMQGQYEKADEITSRALNFGWSEGLYANLAQYKLALQRFEDAQRVFDEAHRKNLDGLESRVALYALAFLRSEPGAMAEQQKWFAGRREETFGLALAGDTEAYRGHLGAARELTTRAVASAIRADAKESGSLWLANVALREAAFGNVFQARQAAEKSLKLAPASPGIKAEVALAFAMAGAPSQAESLTQDLNRRLPLDSQMQSLWLPAIRKQLAINGKNPAYILNDPQSVSPIEYGGFLFTVNPTCLYPIYVRGNAYLAAGRGKEAAAEFQKILDHSGLVWNCWSGALAHLGLARANALQATTSQGTDAAAAQTRAQSAYNDFFTLWKDADPSIPILKQARAEYAELQ